MELYIFGLLFLKVLTLGYIVFYKKMLDTYVFLALYLGVKKRKKIND